MKNLLILFLLLISRTHSQNNDEIITAPFDLFQPSITKSSSVSLVDLDLITLPIQTFLLDQNDFYSKMDSVGTALLSCAQNSPQIDLEAFNKCAGLNYDLINSGFKNVVSDSSRKLFDNFRFEISEFCAKNPNNNCYEMQTAVNFALLNDQDPSSTLASVLGSGSLDPDSLLQSAITDLAANYPVYQQIKQEGQARKTQTVDSLIAMFSNSNLPDSLNWQTNPFTFQTDISQNLNSQVTLVI